MKLNKLISWLKSRESNINAQLLLSLIEDRPISIDINAHKKTYPYLLVSINSENDKILQLKQILLKELNTSKETHLYLNYKIRSKDYNNTDITLLQSKPAINFSLLNRKHSIEELYNLLFYVENHILSPDETEMLAQMLPALIVNNCKNYNLIDVSILTQIASHISEYIPSSFLFDIKTFIINQQREEGIFGFIDPFLKNTPLVDNDKIIISFYCFHALDKLSHIGDNYD